VGVFVPDRRRGHEILDDVTVDAATRVRSIADVARSNVVFGGRRAALHAIRPAISPGKPLSVLDVGTGLADIPRAITDLATRRGARVTTVGVDEAIDLLTTARRNLSAAVAANARALPFRDASVDVVLCSQLLHHFAANELPEIIRELNRVARTLVVIADLRRSWLAAGGFWLASFPLRFHPVTRHDGVVSVLRGFTAGELREAIAAATGVTPRVEHKLGFRLTASWSPRAR
jgi:2-polyprenyl-3-methyl-5-hydroxy-6-metoxy-1,4-benzoquinol methylase